MRVNTYLKEYWSAESEKKAAPCKQQEKDLMDRRIPVRQVERDGLLMPISGCALGYQIWRYICSRRYELELRQQHARKVLMMIKNDEEYLEDELSFNLRNIIWEEEKKLLDKFGDLREILQDELRKHNTFLPVRTVLDDREKSEKPEKGWIQKTIATETTYTYHLYQLAKNITMWNQMRYRVHIATLTETEIERINVLQLVNNIKQHARTAAQLMYIYHSPVNMLDQLLEAIIACLFRNLEINNGVQFRKYDAYLGYQKPKKECTDYEFRIMGEDIEDIIARQLKPLVFREWGINVRGDMEAYRKKAVEITYLLVQDVNDLITGEDIRHSMSRIWTDEHNIRCESGGLCYEILCMIESNPRHKILLDLTRSLFRAADTKELGLSLEDETSKQQESFANLKAEVVTSSFRSVKTALDQGDEGASRESNWISAATQDVGSYTYELYQLAAYLVQWERMVYRVYTAANKSIVGAEQRLQKICNKWRGRALLDKIKQHAKKARAQIKCFNAETDKSFKLDDLLETVILCLHEQDKDLVSIQYHEKTEAASTGGNKANLSQERTEATILKKVANDKYLGCTAVDNNLTDDWITAVKGYLRSTFFSKSNSNEVIEEIVGIFNDIIDQRSKNKWADREWMKQTTVITRSFQQNTGDRYTSHMLKKGYVLFESSEKYILKEGPELFEINELLYEKPTHEVLEELLTDLCGRSVSPQSFKAKFSAITTTNLSDECDNEVIAEDEEECAPMENERKIPSKLIAANPSSSALSSSGSSCPDSRERQVTREQALQQFNEKTLRQKVKTLEEMVEKLPVPSNQKTVMQEIIDQLSVNLLDSGLLDVNNKQDNHPIHGILEQTYITLVNAGKNVDIEAVSLLIKLINDHAGYPGVPKALKLEDDTWSRESDSPTFLHRTTRSSNSSSPLS